MFLISPYSYFSSSSSSSSSSTIITICSSSSSSLKLQTPLSLLSIFILFFSFLPPYSDHFPDHKFSCIEHFFSFPHFSFFTYLHFFSSYLFVIFLLLLLFLLLPSSFFSSSFSPHPSFAQI